MGPIDNPYIAARLDQFGCGEPVLELGAGWTPGYHQRPFRERGMTDLRTHEVEVYDGAPKPDYLGDLCGETEIPSEVAGTVLLFHVLEHVREPWKVADETWRVTQPGGLLIGAVPFRTAIHRWPGDYYAVKPDGLAVLLRRFRLVHFGFIGDAAMPAELFFTAVKDTTEADWLEQNAAFVLRPEVIIKSDYLTDHPFKRAVVDFFRLFGFTLDKYVLPSKTARMLDLGYKSWTERYYVPAPQDSSESRAG